MSIVQEALTHHPSLQSITLPCKEVSLGRSTKNIYLGRILRRSRAGLKCGKWSITCLTGWPTSEEKLMNKSKDMCEAFLLAHYRHNWNDKYTMYFRVISPSAMKSFGLYDTVRQRINDVIDSRAVCARVHINGSVVSEKIDQIKGASKQLNDADYAVHQQRLMKRTDLNRRYWRGGEWMNVHLVEWESSTEPQKGKETVAVESSSPRPKKMITKVLAMRLVRTVLNFLVMPLLKTFWPQDLKDQDSNYYAYYIDRTFVDCYKARYNKDFTPFEQVNVSSASPHSWPVIALAVANLIIADICNAVEAWANQQVNNNQHDTAAKVSVLIDTLTKLNLFSTAHLKDVRSLFF